MRLRMVGSVIAGLLLTATAIVPVAHAGQADQETIFDFQQTIRIPGHVLPPGKYIFELIDAGNTSDLNLIEIFDATGTKLIAIIQTVSAERLEAFGKTVLTFDFRKNGRPPILLAWYYPGDLIGHEFIYSKKVEKQVARADEVTFAVGRRGATPINRPEGNS